MFKVFFIVSFYSLIVCIDRILIHHFDETLLIISMIFYCMGKKIFSGEN